MERISLLAGIDNPARKPQVDVLIPDGEIDASAVRAPGQGYEIDLALVDDLVESFEILARDGGMGTVVRPVEGDVSAGAVNRPPASALPDDSVRFAGAGRGEDLAAGGLAFHLAGQERTSFSRVGLTDDRVIFIDPVPGQPPAVVWLSVAIDRDPFGLGLHERAGVSAELVLARFEGREGNLETSVLELDFHGTLGVVDRAAAPAGGPRLTAQAVGRLVVTHRRNDSAPLSRAIRVQEEVRFERASGTGGEDTVTVLLPRFRFFQASATSGEVTIVVRRDWPAVSRALVEGSVHLAGAGAAAVAARERQVAALSAQLIATGIPAAEARRQAEARFPAVSVSNRASQPIFLLDQRENDEVARADHPAHEAAIAALQRLGQALDEPDFADPRARRLFPPLSPAAAELRVWPTRDWVLFHRRRNKVCGVDTPPPRVSPRRYRLYHVPLRTLEEREVLRRILEEDGDLTKFDPKAAGTVEFAGGLASVQSAHPIVRESWDAAAPDGVEIVFGAIASQGGVLADGLTLAGARLDALAGVLAPVTARAAGAELDVLADVPPGLPAVGLDGIVLYATLAPAAAVVCHAALLLQGVVELDVPLGKAETIATTGFNPGLFGEGALVDLGIVIFSAGTARPVVVGVLETMRATIEGLPVPQRFSLAALVISEAGTREREHAVHRAQGHAMVTALGGVRVVQDVTAGGREPLPFGCPAVTIFFLTPTNQLSRRVEPVRAEPRAARRAAEAEAKTTKPKTPRRKKTP